MYIIISGGFPNNLSEINLILFISRMYSALHQLDLLRLTIHRSIVPLFRRPSFID